MKNSCSMRNFYFVGNVYSPGRAPKTEACLVEEAKEYCHRVLSDVQVDELVLHLQELQNDLVSENARLRRVKVGLDARPVFHTKALWKELCIYVQATNRDNAMKKVRKALRKSGYDLTKLFN